MTIVILANKIKGAEMMEESIFVGRKKELKDLTTLLNKKTASLVVVKGRRRIGKSRLIAEFSKNKTHLNLSD